MGKQVYLTEAEIDRIAISLIDLKERADLSEEQEELVESILKKLNIRS